MAIPKDPVWYGSAMFQSFAVFETILPGTDVPLYLLVIGFSPTASTLKMAVYPVCQWGS